MPSFHGNYSPCALLHSTCNNAGRPRSIRKALHALRTTTMQLDAAGELRWTKIRDVGVFGPSEAPVYKPILGFCRLNLFDRRSVPSKHGFNRRLLVFLSTWDDLFEKTVDIPRLCRKVYTVYALFYAVFAKLPRRRRSRAFAPAEARHGGRDVERGGRNGAAPMQAEGRRRPTMRRGVWNAFSVSP